jgi:preprotein translocase subunit YajC
MELLFPLIFLGLRWVMLVRPQQQRVRRQRELVSSLVVGDEVVAAGGIMGRIVALDDEEIRLEVAPGLILRVLRVAVNARAGDDVGPPDVEEGTG